MTAPLPPLCAAKSRPVLPGRPDLYFVCTADAGHPGVNHVETDPQGVVLARWPRAAVETYGGQR